MLLPLALANFCPLTLPLLEDVWEEAAGWPTGKRRRTAIDVETVVVVEAEFTPPNGGGCACLEDELFSEGSTKQAQMGANKHVQ